MIVTVTGGSASGKSGFAEELTAKLGKKIAYVATMEPSGKDAQERIARHLKLREGKGFLTVEQYTDIGALAQGGPKADTLLIECISNLTANEMFSAVGDRFEVADDILVGVKRLSEVYENLVIVTNEIGSDGIPYSIETAQYIAQVGKINQGLAEWSDVVFEVVCGNPVCLKGSMTV